MARLVQRAAEARTPLQPERVRQPIAHELAECAADYRELLSDAGLIERAEAHRLVAERVRELLLPDLIAVDAFTGYTSAQESFLQAASSCTEVIASLVYDPVVPATSCAHEQVTRLAALAGASSVTLGRRDEPRTELGRLASALGTTGSADVETTGEVVLSQSWGRSAEAARIVCEVQTAMSDGMQPGEIAVVLREVGRHLSHLGQAFAEAGLPVEFDARVPFSATALGRTLTLLLKLESLGHADIVDLLASPYTQAPSALVDEYDAFVRRTRPGGSATHTALRWFANRHPDTAA
ncbi:hypothetical protein EG835_09515, partial [bacterium]|nr:hypothetical protein [bacterium]